MSTDNHDYAQQADSKFNTTVYDSTKTYDSVQGRPKKFDKLRKLTVVSFILYLLSSVVGTIMAMDESLLRRSLQETGALTETQIEDALEGTTTMSITVSIVMAAVATILYVVVLIGVSRAKNWGRVMGIILAIVGGIFTLSGSAMSIGDFTVAPVLLTVSTVIIVAWIVVSILWLITAFNPQVRNYFKSLPAV